MNTDQLQPLVAIWLPTQRWFGGKGRQATITVRELAELPGTTPVVTIWVADVQYADGSTEAYQVPLVMHEQPAETLEHVLLGSLLDDGRVYWVYDALHDKAVTAAWLAGIRDERVAGPLRFTRLVDPDLVPVEEPSLALTVEQSNTSLMFGDEGDAQGLPSAAARYQSRHRGAHRTRCRRCQAHRQAARLRRRVGRGRALRAGHAAGVPRPAPPTAGRWPPRACAT